MFICVLQLAINKVSFLGCINKCQVEKHFRSKQSLQKVPVYIKIVRIFYNVKFRNAHALCQQNQIVKWGERCKPPSLLKRNIYGFNLSSLTMKNPLQNQVTCKEFKTQLHCFALKILLATCLPKTSALQF